MTVRFRASRTRFQFGAWLLAVAAFAAGPAEAQYSSVVVFGDSVSDSGNNALVLGVDAAQTITGNSYIPTAPYAFGTYSNGPVWTQSFAAALGLSATPSLIPGGTNFSFGGARTSAENPATAFFPPSLKTQSNAFLAASGGVASSSALYVVAGGGNDARDVLQAVGSGASPTLAIAAAAQRYASDIGSIVDTLQAAGAQNIIVWNTPNIGLTPVVASAGSPASILGTTAASAMNGALASRLSGEAGVLVFDVFGLLSSPAVASFANVTDACGAVAGCDASSYLFWDGLHPTTAGHSVIASAMLAVAVPVPEPSTQALTVLGALLLVGVVRRRAG